jgi:N-formylglutamate amidohydrolase
MHQSAGDFQESEVREPATQTIPFVFNSPHSGNHFPVDFLASSHLDTLSIRRSADHYVDELLPTPRNWELRFSSHTFRVHISMSTANLTN